MFAEFAFSPSSKRKLHCDNRQEKDKQEPVIFKRRRPDGTAACTTKTRNTSSQGGKERMLTELELIRVYRLKHRSTVDDFNHFLISLESNATGRYWALVACLLSVQCRDGVALEAVRALMRSAPNGIHDIHALSLQDLEEACRKCNFYRTKALNLQRATALLVEEFHGSVPTKYEELVSIHGVGAKIAHLMASVAFGDHNQDGSGIVVDTHVHRIALALEWVPNRNTSTMNCNPERTREALQGWVPKGEWASFSLAVVGFGQLSRRGEEFRKSFLKFVHEERSEMVALASDMIERVNNFDPVKTPERKKGAGK